MNLGRKVKKYLPQVSPVQEARDLFASFSSGFSLGSLTGPL
jgi:hypothetical protein